MKIVQLDAYDRKLLYELDRDASLSLQVLAKKLRRSKPFVLYRMQRLEEARIIQGYHAIIDMSKLGYFTFRVYMKLQNNAPEQTKQFIQYLQNASPNIWTITRMHGMWDYAIFIGVQTMPEVHSIWEKVVQIYKPIIRASKVALYSPIVNFNRTFFIDQISDVPIERQYGVGSKEPFDDTDKKIIDVYASNVRLSAREIASKVGSSSDTVIARIKRLEQKKIISGYKIHLNLELLGYTGYRVDLELNDAKQNQKLREYCRLHANIYQINYSFGGADFEIEVVVRDQQELIALIDELKEQFSGVINAVDYFGFSSFPLLQYIPD